MSSFTGDIIVKNIGAGLWEIYTPFEYHVGEEGGNEIIVIEKGFITDFASVPRIFWIIIPPDGQYTAAAIVHDFTYNRKIFTRLKCDLIFLEGMKVLKVNWFKRHAMFHAVRKFGWIPWNHKDKKSVSKDGSLVVNRTNGLVIKLASKRKEPHAETETA